ncbi:MAG: M61 family metallopeptidase [Chloroflexi bacterium]|nr:M61 family metallopeptidase [Chloroflexota bacterium]
MKQLFCFSHFLLGLILCGGGARATENAATLRLEVDAREISRQLLHARQEIPAPPGPLALWYPKWVPGTHAPGGPVQNIAGLRLETPEGKPIPWRRDEAEPYRIACTVPDGANRVVVRLDYICNQPSVNSVGVDSFGNAQLGVIDWNTCLLYPEGVSIDDLRVSARLLLPHKWRFGTALKAAQEADGSVEFKTETLRDFIDCPLICGEHFRTIDLKVKDLPPTFLHLTSESPAAIQLEDPVVEKYRRVVSEAGALFGGAHFNEYHFLVVCSDQVGHMGVEHLSSSMNGVGERDLIDDKKRKGWVANLLPHEFVHSWCGKHRRPAEMVTANFHTPERTKLLWVYEGLTEYLGEVLMVRSGLVATNDYLPWLANKIDDLMRTEGRRWRSLEDTATASHLLRARSRSWESLRRSQDYYHEGLLLWLEADAIIRQESDGRRSLDDFCKKFMGPGRPEKIAPYEQADVVKTLQELAHYDWDKFIHDRVDVPQEALPLEVVGRCGYRLQYAAKPSQFLEDEERDRKVVYAVDSLGLTLAEDGKIVSVVPGMAGDKAGLAPGRMVQGVNGRKFSSQRVKDAIADSVSRRAIEFLVLEGDTFRTITVNYADGPKYLELVRDSSKPDLLMDILKPVAVSER